MAVRYHAIIRDASGQSVATITNWRDLRFSHVINGLGAFALELNAGSYDADLFELDGKLEVYRSNLALGIPKYLEFEGLIRAFERRFTSDGHDTFQIEGRGPNDFLERRIVAYNAGSAGAEKTGVAESVMKEYVDENAGPGATVLNGRLAAGVTTGLSIETDGAAGSSWTGARAYRNLLEVMQEIGAATEFDFDIVGIGDGLYEFRTYEGQRGSDRTTAGLDHTTGLNAAGNIPVIFSLGFGNMRLPVYRDSRLNESNRIFLLGEGAEAEREIYVANDALAQADSPVNLRETSRDARNEVTAGLTSKGAEALAEYKRRQSLSLTFRSTLATQYGRDFFKGDLVTCQYKEIQMDKKITSVTIQAKTPKAETIELEFADIHLS